MPENKQSFKHESNGNNNCNWCAWNGPQKLGKSTGRIVNQRTNRDHPSYGIVEIWQNTDRSSWDLKWLTITQTSVPDHIWNTKNCTLWNCLSPQECTINRTEIYHPKKGSKKIYMHRMYVTTIFSHPVKD